MQCLVLSRCLSNLVHVSQAADEHKASALLCRAGVTHGAWVGSVQPGHAQGALTTHATTRYPVPPSPSSPEWEPLQLDLQAFLDGSQYRLAPSCTGPPRARALELKEQLLVINSMDYSPKQPCLFPQQGWMLPKQQRLNSPLCACLP